MEYDVGLILSLHRVDSLNGLDFLNPARCKGGLSKIGLEGSGFKVG